MNYSARILPMPKTEGKYFLQYQYTDGGVVWTDDNSSKGYTLEEANEEVEINKATLNK